MEKIGLPRNITLSAFVSDLENQLKSRSLGQIVSFAQNSDMLEISFNKLGKSTIFFQIEEENEQVILTRKKEKIALTHKAFKQEIEGKLQKVFEKLGANTL